MELRRDLLWETPPGADRGLGAGRGRQRGERIVTVNGRRRRNTARGSVTSGVQQRVAGTGELQLGGALHHESRQGAGENQSSPMINFYRWGVGRKEGERTIQKTVEGKVGAVGLFKSVMIRDGAQVWRGHCQRLEYHHLIIQRHITHQWPFISHHITWGSVVLTQLVQNTNDRIIPTICSVVIKPTS